MGAGLYFAYTPDGGYYHVDEEDATLLRVRWKDLADLYGVYPDNPDGIQRDSEQIIVPGPVPPELIEVEYFQDEWWPIQTAAGSIRGQRSLGEDEDSDRVVYFDMDGVLADFNGGYRAKFGRDPGTTGIDPNITGLKGTNFFSTLDKLPGADQMIGAAIKLFGGYSICSSPLRDDYDNSKANKIAWIVEHLPHKPNKIVITGKKDSYAKGKNILIDDRPDNIESWRGRGGIGILYSAYLNDWRDVIKTLQDIKEDSL
jgi:5'(3')-deoxyribonucleotidase